MKKSICVIASLFVLAQAHGLDDPWKPFQFMIGDWVGNGSGKPGEGAGEFSLKPDLDNKILVRRNHSEYPPRPGQAQGIVHDDLMIIYPAQASGSYRAEYFDNEGHVIHYNVSFRDGGAVFLSDSPATAPRFRLTYSRKAENSLGITFEIAQPNQEFRTYLNGAVTRK